MKKHQFTVALALAYFLFCALGRCGKADPVVWSTAVGGNGHSYEFVNNNGISWDDAQAAAVAKGGYLATITSQAENEFIFSHESISYFWLGGYQPDGSSEPDGGYTWVTGEPFIYTNWHPGEPNDFGGIEKYLEFDGVADSWNDQSRGRTSAFGYVIEYGAVYAAPSISSLAPNPVSESNDPQQVTVSGTGFVSGMTGVVTWSTGSAILSGPSSIVVDSATQARIFITTQIKPDNWTLQVTNPDRQNSNIFPFQVVPPAGNPAPTITDISPNPVTGSPNTQTITVSGTGFLPGMTGVAAWPTGSTMLNGPTKILVDGPTRARVFILAQPNADTWTLKVTNTDGQSSNTFSFQVIAPVVAPIQAITSSSSASGTVGQAFKYQIKATLSPAMFAASGLPAGLTVNAVTGLISGTPTIGGTFPISLSADSARKTLTLTLAQINSLPTPTSAPPTSAFPASPFDGSISRFLTDWSSQISSDTLAYYVLTVPALHGLINPDASLKNKAAQTADFLTGVTAGISISQVAADGTELEAAEDALLPYVGFVAPDNGSVFLDEINLIGSVVAADHPAAALVSLDSFILSNLLTPQLRQYAQDPPSANFQAVVVAETLPAYSALPSTGDAALDKLFAQSIADSFQSSAFLKAVNASYDRYSGALAAGDGISAALQLEAMLDYLLKYDRATQAATADLQGIVRALRADGIANLRYDSTKVKSLQAEIAAHGVPKEVVDAFTAAGLTADQIQSAANKFLLFNSKSVSGTLSDNLLGASGLLSQASSLPVTVVTLSAPNETAIWNGAPGVFRVQRFGDVSGDLLVHYTVKGTAAAGIDYVTLKGARKIKAGKDSALIKVKPVGARAAGSKASVKLTLTEDDAYMVGTSGSVKVKLLAPAN